ncbi:uncharacterized protein VP01_2731g1 [Puccinia sorghi]|uniref:Retrotransposon gag domain-containing protein n=1 Tax=Puccinia sorghi TaxID=27349 RepID=A0A0L6V3A3_9BASI|nr:uncharacterized protein VP01_2731g1 [Puccinia sorghi]
MERLYIAQFRTLQSRINWNDAAFTFHFQKGLPSRITNQLALTELNNFYHNKIQSSKKANSTPSTSKNEDALRYKKNFPLKPSPSASTSAPRSKKSTKISLVLNKEGQLNLEEQARREKEGLCLYCGGKHELDCCVKRIAFQGLSSLILQINLIGSSWTLVLTYFSGLFGEFFERTQLLGFEEDKVDLSFFKFSQLQMGFNGLECPWDIGS